MRWFVLSVLAQHGPMTDERFRDEFLDSVASHSGAATRRSELVRLDLVASAGHELNVRGNSCTLWQATQKGRHLLTHGSESELSSLHRRAVADRNERGRNSQPAIEQMQRFCDEMRTERDLAYVLLRQLAETAIERDRSGFSLALKRAIRLLNGGDATT